MILSTGCSSPSIVRSSGEKQSRSAEDLDRLYHMTCEIGQSVRSVQGTVLLKAKSSEASGQYPADVMASAPDQLRLDVTNVLGGTEASIRISHNHFEVLRSDERVEQSEGPHGSWGGIPLYWATDLFLGRIPCSEQNAELKLSQNSEGDLIATVPEKKGREWREKFVYRYQMEDGKFWPVAMNWERIGSSATSVDFRFEAPEKQTLSPMKWEAKSQQGAIKVRWRERKIKLQ